MTEENEKKDQGSSCGCGRGGKWIWIGLAVAVFAVLLLKNPRSCGYAGSAPPEKAVSVTTTAAGPSAESAPTAKAAQKQALPRLVDLGATKCIPCKIMAPILTDLKKTYAGQMDVQFIDVWENPGAGKKYGIKVIPTQIFYDAKGNELFRHEGFFSKEDILAKWKELGIELNQQDEASD